MHAQCYFGPVYNERIEMNQGALFSLCLTFRGKKPSVRQLQGDNVLNFDDLGLSTEILMAIKVKGYSTPTPIQVQAIPHLLQGHDLLGIAQTGTGKTAAFALPLIDRLMKNRVKARPARVRALILTPTRELASQILASITTYAKNSKLSSAVMFGGVSERPQIMAMSRGVDILVATPGRLIDLMEQGHVRFEQLEVFILDEADRMLDMGFLPQIQKIFQALPKERQTMLFSATMPPEIMRLASAQMKLPIRVEMAPTGSTVDEVTQELFVVKKEQKLPLLKKLLEVHTGPTLVFTRTKYGAARVMRRIRDLGVRAAEIHSNRSLSQRREALEGFKSGKYRVLVATDIASRGIDVVGIEVVLNFDMPSTSDDYVHRIGRTARAGAKGHAITFAMPQEGGEIRAIERLTRKVLPISKLPDFPGAESSQELLAPGPERLSSPRPGSSRGFGRRPASPSGRRAGYSGFRRRFRFR
ncbi:MAG TPA: DEAD/DEAH box helicase [Bdellovibrionales bacterium]|nr:DEAD/DEAH box helicase [Bdellovibrionales bacterium]